MPCDVLDFRCIMVSELVGSAILAVVFGVILYFIIANKLKMGFDTAIFLALPVIFLFSLVMTGFSAIYAFASVMVAIMLAWMFNKIIGN